MVQRCLTGTLLMNLPLSEGSNWKALDQYLVTVSTTQRTIVAMSARQDNASCQSHPADGALRSSQRYFDTHIQLVQSMLKNTRTEVINVCEAAVVPRVHAIRKINPAVNSVAS